MWFGGEGKSKRETCGLAAGRSAGDATWAVRDSVIVCVIAYASEVMSDNEIMSDKDGEAGIV